MLMQRVVASVLRHATRGSFVLLPHFAHFVLICRREFWSAFAMEDQKEGMHAFLDKRKPAFKDR